MLPSLKFLHSMRERGFLESALTEGLMLTDHEVQFKPAESTDHFKSLLADIFPLLTVRLAAIDAPWETLSEERRNIVMRGIGSITGKIPMLCFTEVPQGRDITYHHLSFGGYGLVAKREWLERNGGDRVLYLGDNSPVSRHLFRTFASLQIYGLHTNANGLVLFDTMSHPPVLDLLAYIETRQNLAEFEWRIAGKHGFMGGGRNTGERLPIQLDQIESVLVQNDTDVIVIEALIASLASNQKPATIPNVLCQPAVLDAA